MDFRDLAYFEAVAAVGHLGQAADQVGRTQSALSKSIRRLEEELGIALFERRGRGIVITPAGSLLLERAKVLRRAMDIAKKQLVDFRNGISGHVRLGVSSTMADVLLPDVSSRFLMAAPDVTLQLTVGLNDVLRDSLQAGQIDLMLGPLEEEGEAFACHPILADEVVIVAGPNHPILSGRHLPRLADLATFEWVLPSRQVSTRRWLENQLRLRGVELGRIRLETNAVLGVSQVIARNNLLTLLSRRNLGAGRPGHPLQEVQIPDMVMRRRFGVLYREEAYLTPAAICLLNLLRRESDHFDQS